MGVGSLRIQRLLRLLIGHDVYAERAYTASRRLLRRCAQVVGLTVSTVSVCHTVFSLVGYPASISGASMKPCFNATTPYPTWRWLRLNLDWVFVNAWAVRNWEHLTRGDIVVYLSPKDPNDFVIKRVVGLAGDVIVGSKYSADPFVVPPGHIWTEGDNTANSVDSNHYGAVALGLVFAKASHVIWPPQHWRKIESTLEHHAHQSFHPLENSRLLIVNHQH